MPDHKPIQISHRERLNALGKSRTLRGKDRSGVVVGFGITGSILRVKFDDLSQPVSLHRTYLERDARAEAAARLGLSELQCQASAKTGV